MKYIRTKYDAILKIYADRGSLLECENGKNLSVCHKKYIVKQADTIEELCDEFVVVENGGHYIPAYLEEAIDRKLGTANDEEPIPMDIYGAIWTDDGLIYVAKMNEKGELELL